MTEVKISELPSAATLSGSELLPVVQGGVTSRVSASNIAALGGLAPVANLTILGNNTGSTATPVALTVSQVQTLLALGAAALLNVGTAAGQVAAGNDARFTTVPSTTQAGAYTFTLADVGTLVASTSASSVAFTVAPHSSVASPVDAVIDIVQYGAGVVTVTAGAGVTIHSLGSKIATAGQYAGVTLHQMSTDVWLLVGALA